MELSVEVLQVSGHNAIQVVKSMPDDGSPVDQITRMPQHDSNPAAKGHVIVFPYSDDGRVGVITRHDRVLVESIADICTGLVLRLDLLRSLLCFFRKPIPHQKSGGTKVMQPSSRDQTDHGGPFIMPGRAAMAAAWAGKRC